MKQLKIIFFSISICLILSGCGIGSLVALPFKVTGAIVDVVIPSPVGSGISDIGEAADGVIPF